MHYCKHFKCKCEEITVKRVIDAGDYCDLDCLLCKKHLNENSHVYCTECNHFNISGDEIPNCHYETFCDIYDCEDSKPLKFRPYYEAKSI